MLRRLLLFLFITIPLSLFAQSSGKITGFIQDKDTGEPLVGVNVILEGTSLGAMTDVDGYYVVLNVPVATYKIRANYVGYQDVIKEGVRVSAGVTTNVDFELSQQVLETDAVVVVSERPLVEKNVTQSYSLVTSKDLESIPVRGLNNYLALQPSVVVQDGVVHIRGGRSDEVGYYLDGASTSSALSNTNAVYIIQDAVEETQVLTGGYSAEFGGANSGIIRTQLKSGTSDFRASLDYQLDGFAAEGEKFLDTYSYQHRIGVVTLSGPIMGDKIKFYLAGENYFQGDDEVRFGKGFTFNNLVDANPSRTRTDTVNLSYPDGFTPRNQSNRYALNGTISFDFNPINFRLSGAFNTRRTYTDGAPWLNILRDREVYDDLNSYLVSAKMTHILSPTTFYEVNLGAFSSQLERGDSYLGNDWMSWYDSSKVAAHGATYRDAWRPDFNYVLNGIPFSRKGAPSNFYRKLDQSYFSGSFNLTSQLGRHHEIKAGAEVKAYTVRYFDIAPSVMLFAADPAYGNRLGITTYGSVENVPVNVWNQNGGVDSYGYDIYGNAIDAAKTYSDGSVALAPKKPVFGALYLQDKIEYDDLIINAGLRMDYFDPDDRRLRDPANVKFDKNTSQILASEWIDMDPFVLVSPRLGFSFPVDEKTVFYLQYGKFAQMPSLSQIYTSERTASNIITVGGFALRAVGFGLDPVRTTNYEVGFRRQLSDYAAFDITGFYRNIKGQVQTIRQKPDAGAASQVFNRLVNGDFATTKGLEFKMTLRRYQRLQAQFNYTFTDAEGTGSGSTSFISAAERDANLPTILSPLDYAQRHRGSINLDYRFGKGDGGPVFENFGANMLFTFNSGHPYTRVTAPPGGQVDPYTAGVDYMADTRSRSALEPLNSSTTPWNFVTDLRLDKTINVTDQIDATFYVRVNNLFNTKNVINVYQKTGSATDDGYLTNPALSGQNIEQLGPQYRDMYQAIVLDNGGAYRSQLGLELFGQPRQIFFGVKLTY